jgi:DNA-binding beta-propeller fold protein YncE
VQQGRRLLLVVVAGAIVAAGSVGTIVFLLRSAPAPLALQVIADVPLAGGPSRFDYQSLDSATHRLFVAHLGAGIVSVVDVTSNRVVTDIPGVAGVHGVLAVPELGRVYASATDAHQVVVIDEHTLTIVARMPGGAYPDGLAYVPPQHEIYVSDEAGAADVVIDTQANQRVATIPLGGEAGNTQYDPISGRVYVDVQTRNELAAIDPATHTIVARYALAGCAHDHGLLIDAPQRLAFIACDGNAMLLVMDLGSMRVVTRQTVGDSPDVLALDGGAYLLYVACESGVLSVLDERDRAAVRKVGEGYVAPEAHSVAVDAATHRLYLPLQDVNGRPVVRIALFQPASHP